MTVSASRVLPPLLAVALSGVTAADAAADDDAFRLGGAVRFNLGWLDYGPNSGTAGPDLELLRIDAGGARGSFSYSLQYRWYDGFHAPHHAWLEWSSDDRQAVRIGIQQVPFGLLPYASNSFWFGSGYYLGIEDDYDLGVVWRRVDDEADLHVGLFLRDEYGTGARYDRYSFDVATTAEHPYRERERLNLRHARRWTLASDSLLELGLSGFLGRIENRSGGGTHAHRGAAVHGQMSRGGFTVQGQWARYRYAVPERRLALSAFQFPFEIAARADVLTANLAWQLPVSGWLDTVTCYNNYSTTLVRGEGLRDSQQNVTGCSLAKGVMFTYVDWIAGRNMWFVGGPGIGIDEPGGDRWRSRLNINVGFYF